MKLFMSLAQLQALYDLLNHKVEGVADEEAQLLRAIAREVRAKLLRVFLRMIENERTYATVKFKGSEVEALRLILSRIAWIEPLRDSVRVYVLAMADALL